ncbi:ISL3 family transposase [Ktedonobacter sp. SOSP1-52]|uniref:ISL3 family transposase n=1 Tax=Ktedonobacter sp. SOSP1-52 TaxID=2778366 RepID=UPI001915DE6E|nr:ISL3 family transposase [Ktedonobacter sp. SOSP1-52]GHO63865.1 ISL3 family transposase [Ktedonobacter sp. SOSP1-52]
MSRHHTKEQTEEIAVDAGILVPLDLPEFCVLKQEWSGDGSLCVTLIAKTKTATCPRCHQCCEQMHDCRERVKRDINLRDYPMTLILLKRRFRCRVCRKPFTEPDTAYGPRRRTTAWLREAIGRQAATQPVAHVAQSFRVGARFVGDCFQHLARPLLEQRGLSLEKQNALPTPRSLGLDEFAMHKGHRYATILCDLEAGQVLEGSDGRRLEDVVPLLKRLATPQQVEAVSMDMSASFAPAVRACLPHAQIVIDHFHVIQHVMKAFRKVVSAWAHKKEGQILLYHKQHLFLRAQESLTQDEQAERARIGSHLSELEVAWQLKETLRTWYATATIETAEQQLDDWIDQVREKGPDALRQALSAFIKWKQEILAFFRFLPTRISNGFVEGKNNRTKAIMRQAYGYRNLGNLRLRILIGDAV